MSHHKKRSDKKEATVVSDDSRSEKTYAKEKYSHKDSDASKKVEKRKKSKKERKYAESSEESDGGLSSRKENKSSGKYKEKPSREKYDSKKNLEKSNRNDYMYDDREERRSKHKDYKSDATTEKEYDSKSPRQRSLSEERRKYGKWAEESEGRKDKSSKRDKENSVSYSKKDKKDKRGEYISSDKNRSKNQDYRSRNQEEYRSKNQEEYRSKNQEEYRSKNQEEYRSKNREEHRSKNREEHRSKNREEHRSKNQEEYRSKNREEYRSKNQDEYRSKNQEEYRSKNQEDYRSKNREEHRSKNHDEYRSKDQEEYRSKNLEEFDDESNRNSFRMSSASERDRFPPNKSKRPRHYVDLDDPNRIGKETTDNDVGNEESASSNTGKNSQKNDDDEPLSKRAKLDNINMRTGGAYIPPGKLRLMQQKIKDKSSEEYQRLAWEALKKSIVGMTNKVNSSNITDIIPELLKENIIRGRGVLARAIMQAQGASPTFTRVYAALVAVINTKFPEIGELILKRLIIQYKRGFRRNDKTVCTTAARFLAHLLNQEVVHEVLILEMVTHLLENPTEDSIEIAIAILKECGKKLTQLTPKGMRAMADRVREVLHEGNVDQRVCYMLDVYFAVQKDGFKDFEIVPEELDLVMEEDKSTHLITLDEAVDAQEMLNIFKYDPDYLENEEKYKSVVREILGESDKEDESEEESGSEEEDAEEKKEDSQQIIDMTETNVVCLRRKIYLTIQSSLDFEECAHKLLKLELKPGQILEMCYMILDCCAQQRTYEKLFGLLAQRFCQLNKIYVEPFTEIFENSYKTIHRLETNKLRNVAKFFAHLLYTDAISWNVLSIIKLNEEDTTSSSRIFIKILFQELCEYMGLRKLNDRVKDVTLQEAFDGLFPRDHPHNTRFAINFFTSIGLGGLTDELREHLKNLPKTPVLPPVPEVKASSSSSSSSSSASSSSSSSSSSSESESE